VGRGENENYVWRKRERERLFVDGKVAAALLKAVG